MRRSLALALLLPLLAPLASLSLPLLLPPSVARAESLKVTIDRKKVDLPGHRLEVTLSHPADKVRIKVVGNSGAVLAEVEKSFAGAAAGTALVMTWTPTTEEDVAKIEVWGYDTDGYYSGVAITPWHFNVPHEEVNFETDSDLVRASEVPKLDASIPKITDALTKNKDLGKITLYVVGHTDTMGTTDHNLTLSRKRARAIAAWLRDHGIKATIAYEGLGKSGQLVKTADQVDEPKNRRVEYILALEPPPLPSSEFSWKVP